MICSRREYYVSENREKYRTVPYVCRRDKIGFMGYFLRIRRNFL